MKFPFLNSRGYHLGISFLAILGLGQTIGIIVLRPVWARLIPFLSNLGFDTSYFFFILGSFVIGLTILAGLGVIGHLLVMVNPSWRAILAPRWFSHLAAILLVAIALSGSLLMLHRQFPYLDYPENLRPTSSTQRI